MTKALKLAVVGHTNVGKTSLLRTLTRDVGFGEVSHRPSTTRHVEGARLSVDGEALRGYRDRLRQFLEHAETFCRSQEIGYHRVVTDTPPAEFVLSALRGRVLV